MVSPSVEIASASAEDSTDTTSSSSNEGNDNKSPPNDNATIDVEAVVRSHSTVSSTSTNRLDSKLQDSSVDSRAALRDRKWQPYVAALVLVASHGGFSFGFELTILNTSLGTIGGEFGWCGYEGYHGCTDFGSKSGWVQVGILLGGILGCAIGGFMAFRLGCVKTFIIGDAITIIGVALGAGSINFGMLLTSRLVIGVAVGIIGVVIPTYIAEITPPSARGSYQVVQQIILQIGLFVGTLIGLPLSAAPDAMEGEIAPTPAQQAYQISSFDLIWWRTMLAIGAIPPIVGLVSFLFVFPHETPYYLIMHSRMDEAVAVLKKTKGRADVDNHVEEIELRVAVARRAAVGTKTWLRRLASDSSAMHAFLVGSFVAAFQQFGGINAFYTSSNRLFNQAGLDPELITILSNVLTLVSLLVTILSVFLVEIVGRKPLLVFGALGMAIAVLPGGIMLFVDETSDAATWTAIAGAIVFVAVYSMSWGPVVWVYIFEIMPTDLKGQVGGIMAAINSASGVVMVYVANLVETRSAYVAFSAANIVGALVSAFVVRETQGMVVGDSPYCDTEPRKNLRGADITESAGDASTHKPRASEYIDVVL